VIKWNWIQTKIAKVWMHLSLVFELAQMKEQEEEEDFSYS